MQIEPEQKLTRLLSQPAENRVNELCPESTLRIWRGFYSIKGIAQKLRLDREPWFKYFHVLNLLVPNIFPEPNYSELISQFASFDVASALVLECFHMLHELYG